MVCQNNPCPEYLPKVGDASPIVGDEGNTSNLNIVAGKYGGGRRGYRKRTLSRKMKRGGSYGIVLGGSRRQKRRTARKSLNKRRRKSRRSHRKMKRGGALSESEVIALI